MFKKTFHMSITEYISRVRIEQAKKLILKGDMNIKTIALMVGFTSDISFIRTFKKYESITPGKYRSLRTPDSDSGR